MATGMRYTESRLVAAIVAVLALILAGCDTTSTSDTPNATEVAGQFAKALSAGDSEAAAALTNDPTKATADLNFATEALQQPQMSYAVESVDTARVEATAHFNVTLKVLGRDISYKVEAPMMLKDNVWTLTWAPSVIHPKLTSDTHLEIVPHDGNKPVILDRNGQQVMSEQLVTVIRVDPTQITDIAGTAGALADAVSPIEPSITADSVAAQITGATEPFSLIALRPEDAATVAIPELPGVSSNKQARLLTSAKGLSSPAFAGLNDVWQQQAMASTGWSAQIQDAQNQTVETIFDAPAAAVTSIPTTLDLNIQAAAQGAVNDIQEQAVVIAIQPSTGGILAVAQNAAADAEGPIALTGQYPPGSTFKVVTTADILASGAATPDTVLPCPGTATIKGRTIPNDDGFDLGNVPLHTAFAHSCNTTMATLAADLPYQSLEAQAASFGLGVDYVAQGITTITGKAPAATTDAEMVENSIGQGKVVASPFGMAMIAATVAHGSTPLPVLVAGTQTTANQTPAAPSPQVITDLQAMMTETVTSGTATGVKDLPGIAGKTGTAQFGDGSQSHGWFIGYYKDLAFAVLLVGGGSSAPAVTVAGNFLRTADPNIPTV